MKLISCISQWLDRPDLEIGSFDCVADLRDAVAWACFVSCCSMYCVIVGFFSGELDITHTHGISAFEFVLQMMADGSSDEEEFYLDVILLHEDVDRP